MKTELVLKAVKEITAKYPELTFTFDEALTGSLYLTMESGPHHMTFRFADHSKTSSIRGNPVTHFYLVTDSNLDEVIEAFWTIVDSFFASL